MTSAEYERLFADIIKGIRSSDQRARDLPISAGSKNRILGASGYKHQIDVSFVFEGKSYIAECKKWKSLVGVQEILVLASRRQDIEARDPRTPISALIVSQIGTTSGAKKLANHFGIDLTVARSGAEFGLQLGKRVFIATQNGLGIGERVSVTVREK